MTRVLVPYLDGLFPPLVKEGSNGNDRQNHFFPSEPGGFRQDIPIAQDMRAHHPSPILRGFQRKGVENVKRQRSLPNIRRDVSRAIKGGA
jgi:hypothetical protein